MRGYYAGFTGENEVSILCKPWNEETDYGRILLGYSEKNTFSNSLVKDELKLSINGDTVITAMDSTLKYGMVGYAKYALGRTKFNDLLSKGALDG